MSVLDDKFNSEQNAPFIAQSVDHLFSESYLQLKDMITRHDSLHSKRLLRLEQTYLGYNHGINARDTRDPELADYRATHDFAKFISDFITGYVVGNAVTYTHQNKNTENEILDFNELNDIETHDFNMVEDCSIYGRAYELMYRNEHDEDKLVQVSPFNAFMIHDNTLEKRELAGVVYFHERDKDDKLTTNITVYTPTHNYSFVIDDGEVHQTEPPKPHYYGKVQLNEWSGNRFMTCDFEHVLDLFDLYDMAQSDTANYMTDLNDALLKIEGNVKLDPDEAKKMKQARIIVAKSEVDAQGGTSNVNVDYIYKKYDVAGVEAYKDRIKQDIHMLTYTPNLADDNFTGVQSGEAMKYKMTSLEQVRAKKERHFVKSLKKRYSLLGNLLSKQNRGDELRKLKIEFTPNIPHTKKELIDVFNSLGGELSQKTIMSILTFIDDPEAELQALEAERENTQENEPDEYEQGAVVEEPKAIEEPKSK